MFGGFADLTESFNDAVGAFSHSAGLLIGVSTVMALASDSKEDPTERGMRAVARMSLGGMLL